MQSSNNHNYLKSISFSPKNIFSKLKPKFINFTISITSSLFVIILFDISSYFFLPRSFTQRKFPRYKWTYKSLNPHYLKNQSINKDIEYYIENSSRGFDIKKNNPITTLDFTDARLNVFSNNLGCWDKNIKNSVINSEYTYFAGDSFTWGNANYPYIFPNVYESLSNEISLKCGVPHTGQLHQFEKFKEIANDIGHFPKKVIVGYYINDPSNDLAFPHSTIIKGVRIETKYFDKSSGEIKLINLKESEIKIQKEIDKLKGEKNKNKNKNIDFKKTIINFLRPHSLSSHIFSKLFKVINSQEKPKSIYNSQSLFSHSYYYSKNPFTLKNRDVIKQWKKHSIDNNYKLYFLLIPPAKDFNDFNLYSDFRNFLKLNKITYFDATIGFKKSKLTNDQLYWYHDGHLNNKGNEVLGEFLNKKINQLELEDI